MGAPGTNICEACGGILGRDCFNTGECVQITADIARQTDLAQELANLHAIRDSELRSLERAEASEARLLEASAAVIAWWDKKLAHELLSNRDFPWAEDAEWAEFKALRAAIAKATGGAQ